jgi:hypothetical protein
MSLDPCYFDWVFVGRSGGCFVGLPKLATGVNPKQSMVLSGTLWYATKQAADITESIKKYGEGCVENVPCCMFSAVRSRTV